MIKLFASDLDGTLLNMFHQTDGAILRAIRKVTEAGAHFTVATGRTMRSPDMFGFEDVDIEVVSASGAMVLDRDGRIIKHGTIDPAFLEEMLLAFPQVCFECVGLEHSYFTGSYEEHQSGFRKDGLIMHIVMAGMRAQRAQMDAGNLYSQPPARILKHEICKVNTRILDEAVEDEFRAFIADHEDKVSNAPFNPVMFELTDARVNKGAAVAWLADYLGIAEDEVAVYGDGGNDLDMLRRFDASFATSNASADAKRAASATIGSCAFHAVPRHMLRTLRAQEAETRYTRV